MASTIAHVVSGSLIALTATHVQSGETGLVLTAIISAGILDLDHLFYIVKDQVKYRRSGYWGNLHHARSLFHELPGLLVVGVLSCFLYLADPRLAQVIFLAVTIHLVEDWLLGKSTPLMPVDQTLMQVFPLKPLHKIVIDILIFVVGSVLWIQYLHAV